MGLLDKLKNAFFEEEYVEVDDNEEVAKKVEPKKEIKKEEKVKAEEIKNRTKIEEDIDEELEEINEIIPEIKEEVEEPIISDRELVNKNNKIEYFNDSDFVSNDYYREEKKPAAQAYGGAYTKATYTQPTDNKKAYNKPYGASSDKGFQPTPIISPIYGVLDKNYHKDEVIDKKDRPSSYVSKKNVDLDSIRQKAYGMNSLNDLPDYEDIVSGKEIEDDFKEEPLLTDMVEEKKPVVDTVSIADAEQYFEDLGLEYNVDYKDAGYEKAVGRRTAIHEYDDDKTQEIIINNNIEKEEPVVEDNEDDDSELLENNLFDLVDSMYNGDED